MDDLPPIESAPSRGGATRAANLGATEMTISSNDLFIGAVTTDSLAIIGDDEVLLGAAGAFEGADSDVLVCDGAQDHAIEIDEAFSDAEETDLVWGGGDSAMLFDCDDAAALDDDDADVIGGDLGDIDLSW